VDTSGSVYVAVVLVVGPAFAALDSDPAPAPFDALVLAMVGFKNDVDIRFLLKCKIVDFVFQLSKKIQYGWYALILCWWCSGAAQLTYHTDPCPFDATFTRSSRS